jgi:hypothetical protein
MEEKLRREASDAVAIDGTERRCQRPLDEEEQKFYYSGKKKTHTLKNGSLGFPVVKISFKNNNIAVFWIFK